MISDDIFTTITFLRKLPYLCPLEIGCEPLKAVDIMDSSYPALKLSSTYQDVQRTHNFCIDTTKKDPFANVEIPVLGDSDQVLNMISDTALQSLIEDQSNKADDIMKQNLAQLSAEPGGEPFVFSPYHTLEQIHTCFITLRLSTALVVSGGKLLGTITRTRVMSIAAEGVYPETKVTAQDRVTIIKTESMP